MAKRSVVMLMFVLTVSVGLVCAKELKGVKTKKVTWEKDGAKMVLIPSTAKFEQKKTFDRVGNPITKTIKVSDGPNPVSSYMDVTEVTVGQFKKFLKSIDCQFDGDLISTWRLMERLSLPDLRVKRLALAY